MVVKGHSRSMEWLVMQQHDGRLPERRRAEVDAHLAVCGECRGYLETARSVSTWLQSAAAGEAPAFADVWQGVALQPPRPGPSAPWWSARHILGRPVRWGWLAAGGIAAALLLLLVNPFARLSPTPSHETSVAFVESSGYPVMVMMPLRPGDMTVIWLFDPGESAPSPLVPHAESAG
jgi:hypothetical protein